MSFWLLALVLGTLLFGSLPLTRGMAATSMPPDWHKGANVTAWWHNDYDQPASDAAIAALRSTGSTDAAFLTTWYMDTGSSSSIAPIALKTPTDSSLLRAMAKARSLGLRISLKPHVDVRDGTFRGSIMPSSPSGWFADYRSMINHYAQLAQQAGADMLVIGTELTSMSQYASEWRRVIGEVRSRFAGRLTFAANWIAGAEQVSFWDALDYIGIDAYMPLVTGDPNPSVKTLAAAWSSRGYVDAIAALHARYGKPVIFSEAGYQSRFGTAATPWGGAAGAIAQEPQQRAYEAAYRVWYRVPWFKGFYWWEWRAGNFNPGDDGHSPRGKLAEGTMTAWNNGLGDPGQEDTPPGGSPPGNRIPGTVVTVVTLRSKVLSSGRRSRAPRFGSRRAEVSRHKLPARVVLYGSVRQGASACSTPVAIGVDRYGSGPAGWRHRLTPRSQADQAGRFSVSVRNLPAGRYRARAVLPGTRCGEASSRYVRFRISRSRARSSP